MWKKLLVFALCLNFMACDTLSEVGSGLIGLDNGLTNEEAAGGLKQALEQGILKGVDIVSVTDGFLKNDAIKILFPPEVQKVADKLEGLPGGNLLVDKMITGLNRAAEDAAKSAAPIFVDAIKGLTFQDVMGILITDNKLAATDYLKGATSNALYQAFQPVIQNSINKVGAGDAWNAVFSTYNALPFTEKVDADLDNYVTNKALDGLFLMVGKEEQKIRKDPGARVTDLM
ncbi:MAG: DUF4197 domain-containing protein, partial [Bacteroidota bacterium]